MIEFPRRVRRHRQPLGLNWSLVLSVALFASAAAAASAGLAAILLQLFGLAPQ